MLVEIILHGGVGREAPLVVEAAQIVIRQNNGTPIAVAAEYGPSGTQRVSMVGCEDFERTLHNLGIHETVILDTIEMPKPPPGGPPDRGPESEIMMAGETPMAAKVAQERLDQRKRLAHLDPYAASNKIYASGQVSALDRPRPNLQPPQPQSARPKLQRPPMRPVPAGRKPQPMPAVGRATQVGTTTDGSAVFRVSDKAALDAAIDAVIAEVHAGRRVKIAVAAAKGLPLQVRSRLEVLRTREVITHEQFDMVSIVTVAVQTVDEAPVEAASPVPHETVPTEDNENVTEDDIDGLLAGKAVPPEEHFPIDATVPQEVEVEPPTSEDNFLTPDEPESGKRPGRRSGRGAR